MRSIILYTDEPLVPSVAQRFEFTQSAANGEEYLQYTTPQNNKGITAIERMLEKEAPDLNYTLVIEKREVRTYQYVLIELPPVVNEEAYHDFTMHIINGAQSIFGTDVSVGDVHALPNETPEQVLSVVIGDTEEETDE